MLKRILYDVRLCSYETSLVVSESEILGGGVFDGTKTLGTDAVSETTLISGADWGTTTVDCGVNSNVNAG